MSFRPLLAATVTDAELEALRYPLLGFYKYDGIRALKRSDLGPDLLSRKLKKIPNTALQTLFRDLQDVDGELVFGNATAPDCYNRTESVVMSRGAGSANVTFYVFDYLTTRDMAYVDRLAALDVADYPQVVKAPYCWLRSPAEVRAFEAGAVKRRYEGVMLREPAAPHKDGRSTVREQYLLKVKRSADAEAKVLSVRPRYKNTNKQVRDERGYAKRSSRKAGKVALAELGGFRVRDLKTKRVFDVAPGVLTQLQRVALWKARAQLVGKVLKYRYQPAGVKEAPRFPRFVGWRNRRDR